ncbi:MAG: zinc-ribbon domain-containing protein [Thermoplasmata archaeon]
MSVCLHCGELASEGALFCTKCGFTLPQVDPSVGNNANLPSSPAPPGPGTPLATSYRVASSPPLPPPSIGIPLSYVPGGYATLAPPIPGAVGPIPPPPAGKYCIRCRTVISRAAVFCPVCQQPQS